MDPGVTVKDPDKTLLVRMFQKPRVPSTPSHTETLDKWGYLVTPRTESETVRCLPPIPLHLLRPPGPGLDVLLNMKNK